MKKILSVICSLCMALTMQASYGILVNSNTYFEGTYVGEDGGYSQHLAHVQINSGDYFQLCDKDNDAVWTVPLDTWSVSGFTLNGNKYNASVTGCFDFYIKLKYEADQLYIGNGSNCGEGEPYGEPADPDAKFYITGNEELVGADKKWDAAAIAVTEDSYTFTDLAAGVEYALKVTENGSWTTAKGYDDLTVKADGLRGDKDNNICFSLAEKGNVKVTYTSSVFKVEGNFYVKHVDKTVIKFVPSEEWKSADAKFAAWLWGDGIESQWTAFFKPLSEGSDTLYAKLTVEPDSIDFVRFSPKTTEPTWEQPENATALIWGEMKDKMDYTSMVWTVIDWTKGTWDAYDRPCEAYGLMVDGQYVAAKKNVNQSEWTEYMLRNLELTKGQKLQICDKCNGYATWVMEKFAETSFTFPIQEIDGQKYYVVESDGEYDFYIKFIFENDEVYVSKKGVYTIAVPGQCTDVMMQAFYNESYQVNSSQYGTDKYGDTKWATLTPQMQEICQYVDLIWLPPSANGSGMGYHPKQYSNQNSSWGSRSELESLISTIHSFGSKVVADIVINHCEGWTSWCDFPEMDFGEYGKFYPDESYITKNDEVNNEWNKENAGACYGKASGSYDDGENWDGARDWSHNDVYVQDMFKAYLKWMREVMKFDGFRYDKGDGFNNWHHDNYNKTACPYIAFMECYSNTDEIQRRIAEANYNLMGLDFDTKWHVFDRIAGWDYSVGRGGGLLGRDDTRHAITFIDSHDWFLRGNGCEFGGDGNSMKDYMLPRLLQANAFMMSMPSIPCIFYPHWSKYKEFLKPMIEARKLAGVHNESEIKDEYAESGGYQVTIVGKYGYLILCLGNKCHGNFQGFEKKASYYSERDGHDESYEIWVLRTAPLPDDTPTVSEQQATLNQPVKFFENGQLFIRSGEKVYDIVGIRVK